MQGASWGPRRRHSRLTAGPSGLRCSRSMYPTRSPARTGSNPESQHARRNMLILTLTRNTIRQLGEVTLHGAEPREYAELYEDELSPKDDETPQ